MGQPAPLQQTSEATKIVGALESEVLALESQQRHNIRARQPQFPGCINEYAAELQAMKRQHQGKETIRSQRNMPAIGKGHIEMVAILGELSYHVRSEAGIGDQGGQQRREIAPLAVDFDTEGQLEPIDAAPFELRVEDAGRRRQPIRKIVIDADFESLGPQLRGVKVEKVEPVVSFLEGPILGMADLQKRIDRSCLEEIEIGQPLECIPFLRAAP